MASKSDVAALPEVVELKAFAQANYDKGMDTFVECWEGKDYLELFHDCGCDLANTKAAMLELAEFYNEQYENARIEGGF